MDPFGREAVRRRGRCLCSGGASQRRCRRPWCEEVLLLLLLWRQLARVLGVSPVLTVLRVLLLARVVLGFVGLMVQLDQARLLA